MHYEFDPFSPDPNSESYLPDAENPRRSKLRLWIPGHNKGLKKRYTKRDRVRRRQRRDSHAFHQADLAQYFDLERTTESTEHGETPFILIGWDDHLPGISEDDEIRHWTGAPSSDPDHKLMDSPISDPGHERMDSQDVHTISGSPRKWYTFH
ncbi:hypothetical protein B0H12DRAFT_1217015 [Mycena haematopus]|nr:hypothetical protein B0H12DRAFT_1217015 [Mycena haematopus]